MSIFKTTLLISFLQIVFSFTNNKLSFLDGSKASLSVKAQESIRGTASIKCFWIDKESLRVFDLGGLKKPFKQEK